MNEKVQKIEALKERTKRFALNVIAFCKHLPKTEESKIIRSQLIRSATSVGANYRAASRARSDAEFYSKISIVVEEADESLFWLELIEESQMATNNMLTQLIDESRQLVKIINTIRHKKSQNSKKTMTNSHCCHPSFLTPHP